MVDDSKSLDDDVELVEDVRNALAQIEESEETPELGELLKSPETRQHVERMVMSAVAVIEERHSGPLPSPRQLREYEGTLPGGAERIFQMAEREQSHRHVQQAAMNDLRRRVFEHVERREIRGQLIAAGLSLFVGAIGGWLIHLDHPKIGAALIVGTMVSIAGVFITSRAQKNREEPPSEE